MRRWPVPMVLVSEPELGTQRFWLRLGNWSELLKLRLNALTMFTFLAGYYLGGAGAFANLAPGLLGVALVAGAGAVLNQWYERDLDGRMARTRDRPLPSGKITPLSALIVGVALAVAGLACLGIWVNGLTCFLAAFTLGNYLFVYTPLKQISPLSTWVGAVTGAMPPLLGWTATGRPWCLEGLLVSAIVFFWQLPHFLAIAWRYREDYERAGFVMLPVVDPKGLWSGRWALSHCVALLVVSTGPFWFGLAQGTYLASAFLLGFLMLRSTVYFASAPQSERSRQLFLTSLAYLPLLLLVLMLNKTGP
jgi:heme o synthase